MTAGHAYISIEDAAAVNLLSSSDVVPVGSLDHASTSAMPPHARHCMAPTGRSLIVSPGRPARVPHHRRHPGIFDRVGGIPTDALRPWRCGCLTASWARSTASQTIRPTAPSTAIRTIRPAPSEKTEPAVGAGKRLFGLSLQGLHLAVGHVPVAIKPEHDDVGPRQGVDGVTVQLSPDQIGVR